MSATLPIRDDRLHQWPPVISYGNELQIKVSVMTPLRVTLIHEVVMIPFIIIWCLVMMVLAFDALMLKLGDYFLFHSFPFSRTAFLIGMLILLGLWLSEALCGYPLIRWLFGRRVDIRVSEDQVVVRSGFSVHQFSRNQKIAFVQTPFPVAVSTPYQNSQSLCLIIADARRITIAEVFGQRRLEKIVANANSALALASQQSDLDIDPVARRLKRLEAERGAPRPNILRRIIDSL